VTTNPNPISAETPKLCISPKASVLCFDSENAMSFGLFAVGYLVLIIGVAYLAHLMHVPQHYIIAIAIILFGIGIVTGVQTTRHKDPS
jgi:hypothetical protein